MKAGVIRAGKRLVPTGSHEGKRIFIGADHRGFRLKETLKRALRRQGWKVTDLGTHSPRRTDYPIPIIKVARAVGRTEGRKAVGIGICGSGIGASIPAAKVRGVHPALVHTVARARETRSHNNTNFLSLPASELSLAEALAVVTAWLREPFYTDPLRDAAYLRRYLQTAKLDDARR